MSEEEEEIIIEGDDDFNPGSSTQNSQLINAAPEIPECDHLLILSIFSNFENILPNIPITLSDDDSYELQIPTSILPLSMQAVYGFYREKTLLNVKLHLAPSCDWKEKPDLLEYSNPIFGQNFIGKPLIQDVFNKFFSPDYTPNSVYRSYPFVFPSRITPNPELIQFLVNRGIEMSIAENALSQCNNNLQQAQEFILTGKQPDFIIMDSLYEKCPLAYLVLEIAEALFDVQDHCCICRKQLDSPGIKPSTCDNKMCVFAFEQIGVGNSVYQEIARDSSAADLLVSMFSAALGTPYLTPAPPQDLLMVAPQVLSTLPSMSAIATSFQNDTEMIKHLGQSTVDLLRWILLSNRSHIITLPEQLKLSDISRKSTQFLSLISTPDAEKKFAENAKKAKGFVYLWHGSSGDRWYSILRNGLKIATNTSLQQNGNALGKGIYFSKDSNVSFGYARPCPNRYANSHLPKNLSMVGLCSVAKVKSLKNFNWAHTLNDETAVIVRFLFVAPPMFQFDTLNKAIRHIPTLEEVLRYQGAKLVR